ncbi:uncharacterized protein BDZ99DRAFT_54993 [Mytilinidion resinicola]|uniref:Uncharacterized protein n=1 Tax=Mytilinidion resinicola TaxID=574789 RepID=A0A6A6YHU1_9PEZI|nr:uncharacterized protein BDZ99DRAFT_54993 [Mytilinidion resinicola]KAF2808402.1 hypothetical protein BDZ99DRAFT_54993 [Mytilinidion resinicola]
MPSGTLCAMQRGLMSSPRFVSSVQWTQSNTRTSSDGKDHGAYSLSESTSHTGEPVAGSRGEARRSATGLRRLKEAGGEDQTGPVSKAKRKHTAWSGLERGL